MAQISTKRMRNEALRRAGKMVVILGAGATRGADFVERGTALDPCPPLDNDFFTQLEKLRDTPRVSRFLGLYRDEFGPDPGLGMEAFFTQIEFLDLLHQHLRLSRGRAIVKYRRLQEAFQEALCSLFNLSVGKYGCMYHQEIAGALKPGDAVISFNYDTLIDSALRLCAPWRPEEGYGVRVVDSDKCWQSRTRRGRPAREGIKLLKMHGSLNWYRPDPARPEIVLAPPPYDPQRITIIPPMWNKPIIDDDLFLRVWRQARAALGSANVVVVVGYSLPATDLMAQSLLRTKSTSPNVARLNTLVVVNPDEHARNRAISIMAPAIHNGTAVVRLDGMEPLRQYLMGYRELDAARDFEDVDESSCVDAD
ncbi:MAG: SIR2 family protein [Armatimonadetes bacterium]|nr:SIR2 family protein [Armatimonadota bacterium]